MVRFRSGPYRLSQDVENGHNIHAMLSSYGLCGRFQGVLAQSLNSVRRLPVWHPCYVFLLYDQILHCQTAACTSNGENACKCTVDPCVTAEPGIVAAL